MGEDRRPNVGGAPQEEPQGPPARNGGQPKRDTKTTPHRRANIEGNEGESQPDTEQTDAEPES